MSDQENPSTDRRALLAGIDLDSNSSIRNCAAFNNTGSGIAIESRCSAVDNSLSSNFSDDAMDGGIRINGSDNCIVKNVSSINTCGIGCIGNGNFIARNICTGNATNWSIGANNRCHVLSAANAGAISGNSGGVPLGSTDANTNYTF
jgi:hypothetical protein